MEVSTILTILLIAVTIFGTILIPITVGLIKLFSKVTLIETSQKADRKELEQLEKAMGILKEEISESKLTTALIKKDITIIKEQVSGLTTIIDRFIKKIDREISIHQACPNYQEAKRSGV
jgi:CII-binding regulator of phage lambda lysogenization HflD